MSRSSEPEVEITSGFSDRGGGAGGHLTRDSSSVSLYSEMMSTIDLVELLLINPGTNVECLERPAVLRCW